MFQLAGTRLLVVWGGEIFSRRQGPSRWQRQLSAVRQLLSPRPPPSGSSPTTFSQLHDLTHPLTPDFPTYFGEPQFELETLNSAATDGFNINRWLLVEHTGTHLDAPLHFAGQDDAAALPLASLVGPLAIVDIRARAAEDPDTQVTPDDLLTWEKAHGQVPPGAIVAMSSGWDAHLRTDKFRGVDADGGLHFPGFHIETIEFLLAERDIKGLVVDTLSLDYGASKDFAVHFRWLPSNRWGIECAANLGVLPPSGATLIVGGPKIAGATGGPSRLIALV